MEKAQLKTRVVIMLLLAVAFCILASLVMADALAALESSVYSALAQLASPGLTTVVEFITSFGSVFGIVVVVLVLLLIPSTRIPYGVPSAICSISGTVVMTVLKELIARERPPEMNWLVTETSYSFPSGHTLSCTALYVIVLLIVLRENENLGARLPMLIAAIVIPLLVGISRIYLGVHYTGDVLGGFVMGVLVALLIDTILQQFKVFSTHGKG